MAQLDQQRPRPADDDPRGAGRVVVVSTVRATVAVTEQHVNRNLRAGADHVVLCVDDADPAVCARWEGDPHVTAIPTDAAYWGGNRSEELARRQGVNANLVNLALTMVPEATWLFSLDDDECLHIDRDRLLGLDNSVRVLQLTTWEAASLTEPEAQGPRRYKRQLTPKELKMLVLLGALTKPSNDQYFRGHRRKIGVRPDRRLRLFLHAVENMRGKKVSMHSEAGAFRVLHDESPTIGEFIRKWSAHVDGGGFHRRMKRKTIRRIFVALNDNPAASPDARRAVQERLYERVALDDVELLEALGFLEVPDPRQHTHTPRPFSPGDRERMLTMLDALRHVDKSLLSHIPRARPVQALRRAQRHLGAHPELAAELRASLPSKRVPPSDRAR